MYASLFYVSFRRNVCGQLGRCKGLAVHFLDITELQLARLLSERLQRPELYLCWATSWVSQKKTKLLIKKFKWKYLLITLIKGTIDFVVILQSICVDLTGYKNISITQSYLLFLKETATAIRVSRLDVPRRVLDSVRWFVAPETATRSISLKVKYSKNEFSFSTFIQ